MTSFFACNSAGNNSASRTKLLRIVSRFAARLRLAKKSKCRIRMKPLYAQHWAEKGGKPDSDARAILIETYGEKKSKAIEMALLLIQIGSLSGNSFDYFLFRLSRGRWGLS